jgi:hypothetical protein
VSVCYQCRETVRAAECRWVWVQAGGLTATQYLCRECDSETAATGVTGRRERCECH